MSIKRWWGRSPAGRYVRERQIRPGSPGAGRERVFPLTIVLLNSLSMVAAFGILMTVGSTQLAGYLLVTMALFNAALGTVLVARIRPAAPVINRRQHVRILVENEALLDGTPCRVQDISLGGARVLIEDNSAPPSGQEVTLAIELHDTTFELRCSVRRRMEHGYFTRIGLEFLPEQRQHIADLAFAMLSQRPAESDDVTGVAA